MPCTICTHRVAKGKGKYNWCTSSALTQNVATEHTKPKPGCMGSMGATCPLPYLHTCQYHCSSLGWLSKVTPAATLLRAYSRPALFRRPCCSGASHFCRSWGPGVGLSGPVMACGVGVLWHPDPTPILCLGEITDGSG